MQLIDIIASVAGTLLFCFLVVHSYIRRNLVGTFVIDSNEESPLCTFRLEKRPEDFEKNAYVVVKIDKADLSLPGTHKSQ